jgi:hypothetical protein
MHFGNPIPFLPRLPSPLVIEFVVNIKYEDDRRTIILSDERILYLPTLLTHVI